MNLQQIRTSLQVGDNKALKYLYLEFGPYCTRTLINQRGCTLEESEDLFIEAVMILREKVLEGKLEHLTNTKYYLYKVCENTYLARLKSAKMKEGKRSELEQFFYASDFISADDSWDEQLARAASEAWNDITERCKDILYYFYVDALRLAEIVNLMEFSSVDVAKTAKARCYKKLVTKARSYYKEYAK